MFPIMHLVGIRRSLVERHPWLAVNTYIAYLMAKDLCYRQMETIGDLADALDKIRGAVPADDRAFPTSDQVDEVVYGVSRHVTAK